MTDVAKFGQLINQTFPPVEFAFGYGSAFFRQKNHDDPQKKSLYDLIFVVEDRLEWHTENLKKNYNHYGGLPCIFGAKAIDYLQQHFCPIHFNPFVTLDEFQVKYGVISKKDFQRELQGWKTLIVSGRMQKPIQKLIEKEDFQPMINKNFQSAIAAALLLDGRSVINDQDLFLNIVSLSYFGDIRFKFKGENKNKIINIVEGQYEQLQKLYHPILDEEPFKGILTMQESIVFPKWTPENRRKMIELLPPGFGTEYVGEQKDFKQSLLLRSDDQKEMLKEAFMSLNEKTSRDMFYYQLLNGSPLRNLKYGVAKLLKGLKSG